MGIVVNERRVLGIKASLRACCAEQGVTTVRIDTDTEIDHCRPAPPSNCDFQIS